jgi:NAD+ kinase
MVLSLGGDGTMLQTARLVRSEQIPILGVNLGKLGFLAEVPIEDIEMCLEEVLRGEFDVEDRLVLEAHGKGLGKGYTALNDIVLDLSESSRVMHVETWVDGDYLATFTGDGMIVCTPTGSTGYALSNGGPILPPHTKAIMVSPICPHTLTARPVVLPETSIVTLKVSAAPARLILTADGQPSAFLKPPVVIDVRRSRQVTRLVKRRGSKYFDVLRGKLQWGKDVRTDPR